VMVIDLLGPSLDKYFKICGKKFTVETTVNLGIEMFSRIEYVHFKGYLHRDIKPNNFLLGKFQRNNTLSTYDKNLVYIIDFGLSKTYLEEDTGLHYDYKDNRRFVGTPRYASLNTHIGVRQSRRDDIESIVYILIYFLKGELPWQGVKAKTKSEKKEKIKNKKKIVSVYEMCLGLPPQFTKLFEYVRNLKFEETPDYDYMRGILSSIKTVYNFNDDISNMEWEWDKMFLKSKQFLSKENHDEKIYNHYKKHYEKLYEGYPAPSYEEYLENLENSKINSTDKSSYQMMEVNDEKKNENFITSHLNSNGGNNLRIFLNK
jgi:serine/threonine protein kinase